MESNIYNIIEQDKAIIVFIAVFIAIKIFGL